MSVTQKEANTHDFKAILLILSLKRVPCALNVATHDMVDGEGTHYLLRMRDGKTSFLLDESEREEEPQFDRSAYVNDREIEGSDVDDYAEDIEIARKHIVKLVAAIYGAKVTRTRLRFGIVNRPGGLYLTDGWVETGHNSFFDFLFRDYENAEQAFTEFLCTEIILKQKQPHDVCFSGFDDCKEPKYKVDWLLVVVWRAKRMFPAVDGCRIYDVVKARLANIDPRLAKADANVCICCVSLYAEEEQHHQHGETMRHAEKRTTPIFYEQIFQAQERAMGRRRALRPDAPEDEPYCFNINFVKNPYRGRGLRPRAPLPPPDPRPVPAIPRPSSHVKRLMQGNYCVIAHDAVAKGLRVSKTRQGPRLEAVKRTRQSYSEKQAARIYGTEPFSYKFIGSPVYRRWK